MAIRPGERNLVGDIDVASKLVSTERSLVRAPRTPVTSSAAGSAAVGVLATLVDVGASDPALASSTDWTATQNLSIHATGWLTGGPVVVDNRLVRLGTKAIVVAADVYDGRGIEDFDALEAAIDAARARAERPEVHLGARGLVTFARLPRSAASDVDDYDPAAWVGEIRYRQSAQPVAGTLRDEMGLRVLDATTGELELERTPYVANSIGTINGGAQAMMIEAAAEAMRPGQVATDLQIHYLSQVKVGPARSRGSVSRDGADHAVATVELVDAGHGDQLLALATVTLQHPPG